jgi:hypothetical protein
MAGWSVDVSEVHSCRIGASEHTGFSLSAIIPQILHSHLYHHIYHQVLMQYECLRLWCYEKTVTPHHGHSSEGVCLNRGLNSMAFLIATSCSSDRTWRFGGMYCLRSSETSGSIRTALCYDPEEHILHSDRRENVRSSADGGRLETER